MRLAAMKLHTRDQAPREGSRPESENPVQQVRVQTDCGMSSHCQRHCGQVLTDNKVRALQWTPSRPGYLRFLAESKAVYDVFEQVVEEAPKPECDHSAHAALVLTSASVAS